MWTHKIRMTGYMTLVLAAASLAACSTNMPSNFTQNKARVDTGQYIVETAVADLGAEGINMLAQDYASYGSGMPEVTVAYDPYSKTNTAMAARKELGRIVKAFNSAGIKNVEAKVLPVHNAGDETLVQIAYARSHARAPEDCRFMPGLYDGVEPSAVKDYKFGCSVETIFAKQIARPRDLLGNDGYEGPKDGMRNTNVLWPYKSGQPLGQIQGETTQ